MDDSFIIYGLIIISMILILISKIFVTNSYNKYLIIDSERKITGYEATRKNLDKHNLHNIKIIETNGYLTDHYDSTNKIIKLSSNVYHGCSIASVSVALHECAHAIQDKENYLFFKIRSKLTPVVNFSSYAGYFSILIGCLFSSYNFICLGIIVEIIILLFQIITLPVEINASNRAFNELDYSHFFNSKELKQGKIVLTAAALTYVASIAMTIIQIIRLIFMYGRRKD